MAPSAEILSSAKPDPQFAELLKNHGPSPLPVNVDIQTLRSTTNALKAKSRATSGPLASLSERDIEIPVRDGSEILAYVYAPSNVEEASSLPILLFFHGGGFCIGSRHDDWESNRTIVAKVGIIVVSIEYRLAPEHLFPQAIHDRYDALHWIANNPTEVHRFVSPSVGLIISGTSAGGSIANAVVYLNRDEDSPVKISGQFLSVAPLLPPQAVPEHYKEDYVSHDQNKDVTVPPLQLAELFIGE
ncbi:hypothetical protein QQX98_012102 [Neonectria punicea]|uniref:Alpha/beta hydrolase fold-3 domain-containing protein n=1 Tax=Neonectria punicea TaxID=979145 RepID=A0ABR1GK86_9HYPO